MSFYRIGFKDICVCTAVIKADSEAEAWHKFDLGEWENEEQHDRYLYEHDRKAVLEEES